MNDDAPSAFSIVLSAAAERIAEIRHECKHYRAYRNVTDNRL